MKCNRSRPHFKKAFQAKTNVQGNPKLLKFKQKKWRISQRLKPGFYSENPLSRISKVFGEHWRAKQTLKGYYGVIREKQWKSSLRKVIKKTTNKKSLTSLWESRLDVVMWRMRFAPTLFASRQYITHGHVCINNTKVNVISIRLKSGDFLKLILPKFLEKDTKNRWIKSIFFLKPYTKKTRKENILIEKQYFSHHLEVSFATFSGIFCFIPKTKDLFFPYKICLQKIIEVAHLFQL